MKSKFYAFMNRLRFINRWGLMRGSPENVSEHTEQTALIAHALALIDVRVFGLKTNPERAAVLALYHEAAEVITGDLPTPVKYFNSEIREAYKSIEREAEDRLLSTLPPELTADIRGAVRPDPNSREAIIVKFADKLSAYIKCVEELAVSNYEFKKAHDSLETELIGFADPSVDYFLNTFIPAFRMTLDELSED